MEFNGIYTPVITPYRDDYSIDETAYAACIEQLIADGAEVGVNQVVFDKSDEDRNVRTLREMAVIPHGLVSACMQRRLPPRKGGGVGAAAGPPHPQG